VQAIRVRTERRTQLLDITGQVQAALDDIVGTANADETARADGAAAALVFVPHTTAGVTINEHADPAVARDFEAALERMVRDDWGWQHVEEGEENAPSHIRASLMGPQVLVPLDEGRLALGTWQGIFFCELDGPRDRTVYVTALA
jgi:secondary thiamine-phosphate synthase enzyme